MENPNRNKQTADVFARYLENRFGWVYCTVLPEKINEPDFDIRLDAGGMESLFLQLKQPLKWVKGEKILTKSIIKVFSRIPMEDLIKKAESKYKNRTRDLILIIHKDEGYLIPSDEELIDKNKCLESTFRGVYLVSQTLKFLDGQTQAEFVRELKPAFLNTE